MSRRRTRPATWLEEELDRAHLDALDHDDTVTTLSLGELPGWMRKRWARAKMTGKHAWVDATALPSLYTRSGSRLPVDASVATLRILAHTTTTREHDDVALLRDYLHPVSCARLVGALLERWISASNGQLALHDGVDSWPSALDRYYDGPPVDPNVLRAMNWAPQSHRLFHDRHSVEHAVSLLTYGVLPSHDPSPPHPRRRLHARDHRSLVFTLRHTGAFGAAALRMLCYSDQLGEYAREAARLVNPHRLRRYGCHEPVLTLPDVMPFDEQLDAIAALGFASGTRALMAKDGTRRWVGVDLFESLSDGDQDHPIDPDLPRDSIMAAVAIFRYLFAQTEAQLELHRQSQQSWSATEWRELFLEHPYMSFWAKRIIWATQAGESTFRVCDDLSLADHDDDPFELGVDALVHVASAQTISAPVLARWSELFADYEILNPTIQLDTQADPPDD